MKLGAYGEAVMDLALRGLEKKTSILTWPAGVGGSSRPSGIYPYG